MFKDKNGIEVKVGDRIMPDQGQLLLVVSSFYVQELDDYVLFGQQIANPMAFSVLTKEDLKTQWSKM